MSSPLKPAVAFAAVLTVFADAAPAQDKRMEAVCGNLWGARQTTVRMLKEGWSPERIVQEMVNHVEWRDASMQDKKMLMDLLQETLNQPFSPGSEVIRECMQRAEAAPKPQ